MKVEVSPAATEEETAAIVAAVELLWPEPAVVPTSAPVRSAWRFSGRWWSRPVPIRRDRPWF
jgi:hypothetical protein